MSASDHPPHPQDLPFDDFMQALISMCWRDVWVAMPSRKTVGDPDAIHDVRVASRKLRAAMDIGRNVDSKRWYRRLHGEAKRITQAFGALRDADVLLATLRAERESASRDEVLGLDDLIASQEAIRNEALADARRSLKRLKQRRVQEESRKRFPRPSRSRLKAMRRSGSGKEWS